MPPARRAVAGDLASLLELFRASEVSAPASPRERADALWDRILRSESTTVFVAEAGGRVVATCNLIVAPNLLRGGRGHAFLENVVTHPAHRGRGHGRAVVRAALKEAWRSDCHHVLLQSGRADPRVHRFYESCGLKPGLRVGYTAPRPS